ncbi:MAG: GLPGLI family protein [Bacteroidia bacterium]|nr:GLPGLI family protein [Bacteroidia bacterium]NND51427.1 GLPGLI family protein [Flavobacteriaceae bacterium]
MKSILLKVSVLAVIFFSSSSFKQSNPEFQGKAYYFAKSSLELGDWGARLSAAQKKQIQARLKNRLEKTYVLTFNKEESIFEEEDKLDAISGATDSWGKNFTPGDQYKNIKADAQIQTQEFYGKYFLVKDKLQPIEWVMGTESKKIGNYTTFKATASIPTDELNWYAFSWDQLRSNDEESSDETEIPMTEVEAWYTPQIPVSHGPLEYWGLPGLILEVSAGNTTMLCSKIIMNPEERDEIKIPKRGTEITKNEYQKTIENKMREFRDNRMGRRG